MIELTDKELAQIQGLLPVWGSIEILESAQAILNKISGIEIKKNVEVDFSDDEIEFLCDMIKILDNAGKINIASLSLVKKILNSRSLK